SDGGFVSFCKAVDYLQQNTQMSFEDVTSSINWHAQDGCGANDSCQADQFYNANDFVGVGPKDGYQSNRSSALPYVSQYEYRQNGVLVTKTPTQNRAGEINIAHNESPNGMLHELLHALYAAHEHQRWDRGNFVDIDPIRLSNASSNTNFDPVNYFSEFMPDPRRADIYNLTTNTDGFPLRMYGGFDQASIMRYSSGMMLKLSGADLLWHIKQPHLGFQRHFRILLKDGTASPYDNLAINNETGSLAVTTFQDDWYSAQFDIEYVGTFNNVDRFKIWNRKSNQYLFDNNGVVGFVDAAGLAAKGGSAQWNLIPGGADGEFLIKANSATQRYMTKSGNNLGLVGSAPSTPWIIKARTLVDERPETLRLSMMDKVGLHINYGKYFAIRHTDGADENLLDNPALGIFVNGSALSLKATVYPNGDASLYYFTQCGKSTQSDTLCIYDAVFNRNIRTNVAGTLSLNVPNTVTSDFERWELIPRKEGYFHIKNLSTNKYWSKPQTVNGVVGVISMVDESSGLIGEWLLNDVPYDEDEDGDVSYKEGKQRSQSCVDALNAQPGATPVGVNY
ncbi:MAG TPA: M12 family metallopeptidase, partial [Cellvibrionaceae bacterium]